MINLVTGRLALLLLLLSSTGCQPRWQEKEVHARHPPLADNLTTTEIVEFLNRQNQDLEGWQSTSTRMEVRLPNMIPQKLNGAIACQGPNYFRLTAKNMIATADLGSNNKRCWAYVKPGEPAVMTWRHEDTALLQQIPGGVPYIDPNWLMLVLGITPLDPSEYDIRSDGNHILLWSVEDGPNGRPLRREIRVDRARRAVAQHSLYDSEANLLVSATLSNHRWSGNKLIPHHVRLSFPQMRSEIRLTFRDVETNPTLPDTLWHLPDHGLDVVDLGNVIRNRMGAVQQTRAAGPQEIQLQTPEFAGATGRTAFGGAAEPFVGLPPKAENEIPEPDWATSISHTNIAAPASKTPVRRRRSWLNPFGW